MCQKPNLFVGLRTAVMAGFRGRLRGESTDTSTADWETRPTAPVAPSSRAAGRKRSLGSLNRIFSGKPLQVQ